MASKRSSCGTLLVDTRGANLVEYIILVGVVAILCIAAFRNFGGSINSKLDQQSDAVSRVPSGT